MMTAKSYTAFTSCVNKNNGEGSVSDVFAVFV